MLSEVKCTLWQIQELSSLMVGINHKPWSPYQDKSGWTQMGGACLRS